MALKHVVEILESEAYEGSKVLVLIAIGQHCDSDTHECFPGLHRIARQARLSSKRTVRRLIRELEIDGVIKTTVGGGPRGVNLYRLDLVRLRRMGLLHKAERDRKLEGCKPSKGGQYVPPEDSIESSLAADEGEDNMSPPGTPESPPFEGTGADMGGTKLSPPGGDIQESPEPPRNLLNHTRAREAEIFAALSERIGEASFNSWFRCAELHEPPDGTKAVVVAESAFMASHIRQHFGTRLEELLGKRIEVVAHGVRQSKTAKAERAEA